MQIQFVEINNFRKLLAVHIDLTDSTTLLVGANNSGKTSAMLALRHFLVDGGRFSTHDFTLSNWQAINALGHSWMEMAGKDEGAPAAADWTGLLPSMDVWLNVADDEIHYVRTILPTLAWKSGLIGVRMQLEPKDLQALYTDFITTTTAAMDTKAAAAAQAGQDDISVSLWPSSMIDFLDRRLRQHFTIKGYVLDPAKQQAPLNGTARSQTLPKSALPIEGNPLGGLIRIHEINAQRGFGAMNDKPDAPTDGPAGSSPRRESRRLSDQLRTYYANHLDPYDQPDASDLKALAAIETAQKAFDDRLDDCFAAAITEVSALGYPGVSDPRLKITTRLRPSDGLNHEAAVQYEIDMKADGVGGPALRLPEESNGLGYQNLVSMIFQLMSFRDAWMRVGKAGKGNKGGEESELEPLHLVLIEEPEAHLHAQVQQVFIRKAYEILRAHPDLKDNKRLTTQLVVSTHSSHVAHETKFANLRYFRRLPASKTGHVPVSTVVNLSEVFGPKDDTAKFATRYLRAAHCDLFFADAAILVEGPAERMLVPHFIRSHFSDLHQCYITLLEIGGSHSHRLEPLLRHLGLPTLVITDLDTSNATGKAVAPARGAGQTSGNTAIKTWVPKVASVDELLDLPSEKKISAFDEMSAVRIAYQTPIKVQLEEGKEAQEALPYTFEDALVFSNIAIFGGLDGTGLVKKFQDAIKEHKTTAALGSSMFESLKTGKKAEFALDVLALEDPAAFVVPNYISEGLGWLQDQLKKRQLEVIELAPAVEPEPVV
jgi:predicted ATP-dependent endonuclease of OLD family